MIAETMAGIALVKGAVDSIKSVINTANDVSDIAGYIDKLFEGEKQVQQKRNKKAGYNNFGEYAGVASEIIEAKLAQEKIREVATLVDFRFGPGTWQSIVDERAKRIREQKEAEAEAKRLKIKKQKENEEIIKQAAIVFTVIGSMIAAILFVFISVAKAT